MTAAITDLDQAPDGTPARKALIPYETSFTTFDPVQVGATAETFTSGGLALVGDRAYVAQNDGRTARVRAYDVSDPVQPTEIVGPDTESVQLHPPPPVPVMGSAVDLDVQETASGRLLAVATNPFGWPFHPANVRFYDVTDDQPWHWVGAVTIGKDPSDGLIKRVILRGERAYVLAMGIGKGLHVIDLPTARALFATKTGGEETAAFYDLLQSIGLEGRGFGETAVVQSVFIDTGAGLNSQMHDLAVTELTLDGIAQPIAVATGRQPLVIINPQTGQTLYAGPILTAAGESVTSWGTAIEAGIVNGTPIALVSAYTAVGGTGHVLVVVDLSDLANPKTLGTLALPGNAAAVQDILLQDTTAYVGTDTRTYVVSLAELAHPRLVSTVTSVGGRLALTNESLLFGSARALTDLQSPLGRVRSAALNGPLVLLSTPTPVVTRRVLAESNQSVTTLASEDEVEWLSPASALGRVIGATSRVVSATVELFENGVKRLEAVASTTTGAIVATIKATHRMGVNTTAAMALRITTEEGELTSGLRAIKHGDVTITVDSNNDTIVDDADDQAKKAGKAWAFWEADPRNVNTKEGLSDFATVRVTAKVPVWRLQLSLRGPAGPAGWRLVQKAAPPSVLPPDRPVGTLYLSDATQADRQMIYAYNAPNMQNTCQPGRVPAIGNCPSDGEGAIVLKNLPERTHEFLLRYDKCPATDANVPETILRELVVEVVHAGGSRSRVDAAKVDIRPLRAWMTMFTNRPTAGYKPLPEFDRVPGYALVDPAAETLTVLVHGFNVDAEEAQSFTSTYLRRLYWSGHPVLSPQAGHPQVVGISWPGDEGRLHAVPMLGDISNLTFMPEDDHHALASGVAFGRFLEAVSPGPFGRRAIDVVAHSLGNMLVHSGIQLASPGLVRTYVMNEAAVPAEAFAADYQATEADAVYQSHASGYGWPDDQLWKDHWAAIIADTQPFDLVACDAAKDHVPPDPAFIALSCQRFYDLWHVMAGQDLSASALSTRYTTRWTKQRPVNWDPHAMPTDEETTGGAWRGLFANNMKRVTRLVNTFNVTDRVLNTAWRQLQLLQKPGVIMEDTARGRSITWAAIRNKANTDSYLWLTPGLAETNLTHQWAELAYWFPAISRAAGVVGELQGIPQNANIDFSLYGGAGTIESHSYLRARPFPDVWQAFTTVRNLLGANK